MRFLTVHRVVLDLRVRVGQRQIEILPVEGVIRATDDLEPLLTHWTNSLTSSTSLSGCSSGTNVMQSGISTYRPWGRSSASRRP